MITKVSDRLGYVEVVDFINAEFTTPTPGIHSELIYEIGDSLNALDYWMYCQELYDISDPSKYVGVLIITQTGKALLLRGGVVTGINMESSEVNSVMEVDPNFGAKVFYSDVFYLYSDDDGFTVVGVFQMQKSDDRGSEMYFSILRDNTEILAKGIVASEAVKGQKLGGYNIKIDKLASPNLTFVSARNQFTQFSVRISDSVSQEFSYSRIGQIMYAPDTSYSREAIVRLTLEGVIFSNL